MKNVIIVGAGAAGLACAVELKKRNTPFVLIEARDRIGGRVMSVAPSLELGAEFIHGAAPITIEMLRENNLAFYDIEDSHFYLKGSKLTQLKAYDEKLGQIFKGLQKKTRIDMSIHDFVKSHPSRDKAAKAMFVSYVEGFEAADTHLISRDDLAFSESETEKNLNGVESFRPVDRYDLILQKIAPTPIHFNTVLEEIIWEKGKVEVNCGQGKRFSGSKLVLTVPLGVLKSGNINWNQKPNGLQSILDHLEMGHVQKIVFQFRSRFWENLASKTITFFHTSPENYFPTWWTMQPLRTNYLTAWQGGPKALEMSTWSEAERVTSALKTLARFTKRSSSFLKNEVVSAHTHNWSKDPFALGAYSYVGVGGVKFAKKLKVPFEKTIYFAGEATQLGAPRGTLEAALKSGRDVAKLILSKD